MFENPRRGRQAKNFTTNTPNTQIVFRTDIFRKFTLGAPDFSTTSFAIALKVSFSGRKIIFLFMERVQISPYRFVCVREDREDC